MVLLKMRDQKLLPRKMQTTGVTIFLLHFTILQNRYVRL